MLDAYISEKESCWIVWLKRRELYLGDNFETHWWGSMQMRSRGDEKQVDLFFILLLSFRNPIFAIPDAMFPGSCWLASGNELSLLHSFGTRDDISVVTKSLILYLESLVCQN